MVSRSRQPDAESSARQAGKAASSAASEAEYGGADKGAPADKPIAIRLNEYEYNRLKSLFAKEGVKLSTGIKTAALWLAEKIDDGALRITKAGVMDRRG
jgi:hypothetical protein